MSEKSMIEVASLWENVSKKTGEIYFSGYFGNSKLMGFTNKYKKEGDNQPTLKLYIAEKEKKENQDSNLENGGFPT